MKFSTKIPFEMLAFTLPSPQEFTEEEFAGEQQEDDCPSSPRCRPRKGKYTSKSQKVKTAKPNVIVHMEPTKIAKHESIDRSHKRDSRRQAVLQSVPDVVQMISSKVPMTMRQKRNHGQWINRDRLQKHDDGYFQEYECEESSDDENSDDDNNFSREILIFTSDGDLAVHVRY
jgi:hypothetical protein